MRYFLHLRYHGGNFLGWQIQTKGRTVQGELTNALQTLTQAEINLVGCGRTDTGVHASSYYAHFDLDQPIDDELKFCFQLNGIVGRDVHIISVFPVEDEHHARFDAASRSYTYKLHVGKNPFLQGLSSKIRKAPDESTLQLCAEKFIGKRDYSSFEKVGGSNKTSICDIRESYWTFNGEEFSYHVTADRFLRNMIRAIVGTQLDVLLGRFEVSDIEEIILSGSRNNAGTSAPPDGLYLSDITYPFISSKRR